MPHMGYCYSNGVTLYFPKTIINYSSGGSMERKEVILKILLLAVTTTVNTTLHSDQEPDFSQILYSSTKLKMEVL